jgi:hypothetical protein
MPTPMPMLTMEAPLITITSITLEDPEEDIRVWLHATQAITRINQSHLPLTVIRELDTQERVTQVRDIQVHIHLPSPPDIRPLAVDIHPPTHHLIHPHIHPHMAGQSVVVEGFLEA